jgi:hypothetical protein
MFGRVINKIFKRSVPPVKPASEAEKDANGGSPFARNHAPAKTQPESIPGPPAKEETPPVKEKGKPASAPAEKAADSVKKQWAAKAGQKMNTKEAPEVLCGITKQMSKEEIADKLATLYKRHNRAASSLDPQMREEAEIMLEAIATAKEKFLPKK